jgi:NADH dehydrogenase
MPSRQRVVIVGGGFGGLAAAKSLDTRLFETTMIDQQNYHLFQPLLYQVATGALGAPDVATPLRTILPPSIARVIQDEVIGVDQDQKLVLTASGGRYAWDVLILAVGLGHSYFGHDSWAQYAPSLKYLDDAFEIRDRVLSALEAAELIQDTHGRERALRFVVVGGGPTGVELAGAIGELTGRTLAREFKSFDPRTAEILLVEAAPRILPQYSEQAAAEAVRVLTRMNVQVLTGTQVTDMNDTSVTLATGQQAQRRIETSTVIWAAGAAATPVTSKLCQDLSIEAERGGRVKVDEHFKVHHRDDVFVVGDLALYEYEGAPLPGLAPVAEQAGRFVGKYLNDHTHRFVFKDQGQLAVIGRNAAVGVVYNKPVKGIIAWWLWLFVHIRSLIGFDVKLKVMVIWAWKFMFDKYGARIISNRRFSAYNRDEKS